MCQPVCLAEQQSVTIGVNIVCQVIIAGVPVLGLFFRRLRETFLLRVYSTKYQIQLQDFLLLAESSKIEGPCHA